MKYKANKTFLDTLLDNTQQNALSSLYALEPTRSGISQRAIYEAQDVNTSITGTDEDDTVHITGNLTANNEAHETNINLQGGNNTVNIDGKILARNGENILIEGYGSNNSVTVSGVEAIATKDNNSYNAIAFGLYGRYVNSLHVTGDILTYGTQDGYARDINIYMYNGNTDADGTFDKLSSNYLSIDGNACFFNGIDSSFYSEGYENQYTIKGSLILDNFHGFLAEETGIYNELTIGDSLFIKNTDAQILLNKYNAYNYDNQETVYSTLKIANQLHVSDKGSAQIYFTSNDIIDLEIGSIFVHGQESRVTVDVVQNTSDTNTMWLTTTINGDIEANNGGQIYFYNEGGIQTFEVKGKVITQSDNVASSSPNDRNYLSDITFHASEESSNTYNFLGGVSNNNGCIELETRSGKDQINITGDVSAQNTLHDDKAANLFALGDGDDSFTLVGNLFAGTHGLNSILGLEGNDTFSIKGNVSVKDDGRNELSGGAGDDTFILNGHIDAGALAISGDEGNDTLVLTANSNNNFEVNYKDWLTDFSSTGSLVHSSIENIRLDVNRLQIGKLSWFTDIINQANADGAHIAVTDKAGHQLINPSAYLAQSNDTHNPINDVLDHYAPAAANAAQPKAFADHVAAPSTDAFTAPHFDNNNFLHEMEQQAQVHAAAAA